MPAWWTLRRPFRPLDYDAARAIFRRINQALGSNWTLHDLRHTAAMRLLHAGNDISMIALWLGHESIETTQIYIHADLVLKEKALDRTTPIGIASGRYRPPDALLAFLEAL